VQHDQEGVMAARKKWSELSQSQRRLITFSGLVEFVLLAAALIDIQRRPADQINGSKRMWRSLALVHIVGPLAYFTVGRRRSAAV
jgi:hypothetical protein